MMDQNKLPGRNGCGCLNYIGIVDSKIKIKARFKNSSLTLSFGITADVVGLGCAPGVSQELCGRHFYRVNAHRNWWWVWCGGTLTFSPWPGNGKCFWRSDCACRDPVGPFGEVSNRACKLIMHSCVLWFFARLHAFWRFCLSSTCRVLLCMTFSVVS